MRIPYDPGDDAMKARFSADRAREYQESAMGLIADCRRSINAFSERVFEAEGLK